MIAWLSRIFIKDRNNYGSPEVRRRYGMLCGGVGIFLNILLCCAKLLAGALSGSIAITADAFNNLSDAGSSVVTIAGFRLAGQKPDSEHPFGHGRLEYLAGLAVSFLILLVGVELFKSSLTKIITPEEVTFSWAAAAVLLLSIAVKVYMFVYNRGVGKKIDSAAMKAAASDSLSDCVATFAVLASMFICKWTGVNIDGWCGMAVAVFIFVAGVRSVKETVSPLLGQPPEAEFVKKIEDIIMSYDGVEGIHDLIVHDYGPGRRMISVHAEVPAENDVIVMHDLIDNIERRLSEETGCAAVIHMDPVIKDESTQKYKSMTLEIVRQVDPRITIHDFRMVKGNTHTNLIFDAVVPFDKKLDTAAVKKEIMQRIHEADSTLYAVVEIDRQYAAKEP